MKERLLRVANYCLDRMGEQSTWQGIGFVVALCGAKFGAGADWGQAAGLGGTVSAAIKMFLADNK